MATQPIYGYRSIGTICGETETDKGAILALQTLLETVSKVIELCFPTIIIFAGGKEIGTLKTTTYVNAPIFVRVQWKATHKGVVFTGSKEQYYELVDLYLSIGVMDWKEKDPALAKVLSENGSTL